MSPRTQHTNRPSNYVFKMAAFKWMRKISKKLCYKHWTYRKALKLKKLPFKQYIINASSLFLFQILVCKQLVTTGVDCTSRSLSLYVYIWLWNESKKISNWQISFNTCYM